MKIRAIDQKKRETRDMGRKRESSSSEASGWATSKNDFALRCWVSVSVSLAPEEYVDPWLPYHHPTDFVCDVMCEK